jgi:hypothetical protein
VVAEDGQRINDFPVLRYVCRSPKRKPGQHRTFSLLPAQLVPYRQPSLEFLVGIMKTFLASQQTVAARLALVAEQFPVGSAAEDLNASHLWDLSHFFLESTQKLSLWKQLAFATLRKAMDFLAAYPGGSLQLSLDYYQAHGGWQQNSPFLFGTPSQLRSQERPP